MYLVLNKHKLVTLSHNKSRLSLYKQANNRWPNTISAECRTDTFP